MATKTITKANILAVNTALDTNKTTFQDATGAQTYIIQAGAKAAITSSNGGDTVAFAGSASDYEIKISGRTISFKDSDGVTATINIKGTVALPATTTVLFSDGSVDLVLEKAGKATIDGVKITNKYSKDIASKMTPDDSVTTSVDVIAANPVDANGDAVVVIPNLGQTFTLTTGVDVSGALVGSAGTTGTTGDDTFNALTTATYQSLDSLNGGDGTDTLNVMDNTIAVTTVGTTVTNIETANIASAEDVTATTTAWTGLTALNVTQGKIVTVTAGTTTAVKTVSTLTGDTVITGGSTVSATDLAGDDIVVATGAATTSVTTSGGALVTIGDTAIAAGTFTDDGVTDTITTVSITGNAGVAAVNSDVLTMLTIANSTTDLTVTAAAATRAITINASNYNTGAITDDTATTVTLNTTGTAAVAGTFSAQSATTMTVHAGSTHANGTTLTEDAAGTSITAVTSLTVDGAGKFTTDTSNAGNAQLLTIAAGSSTGAQILTFGATVTSVTTGTGADVLTQVANLGATQAINTGKGNDKVVLGGALTAGATVNGGDDTDTLSLVSAVAVTTATTEGLQELVFSNFEVLEISNALGGDVDMAKLDSINSVVLADTAIARVISNLTTGATVEAKAALGGTLTLTLADVAVPTTDTVNLKTTKAANTTFGTVAIANVEAVNLTATDDNVSTTAANTHTLVLTGTSIKTLAITGDAIVDLSTTALAALTTVTASGVAGIAGIDMAGATAAVTYTGGAGADVIDDTNDLANTLTLAGGNNVVTTTGNGNNTITLTSDGVVAVANGATGNFITAGNGNNTITDSGTKGANIVVGTGANTIVTGSGNDFITVGAAAGLNTVNVGTGTDTVILGGIQTAAGYYTTVTGMSAGDVINFAAVTGTATADAAMGAAIVLGGASTFANYLDAAAISATGFSVAAESNWFQFGGNTYLVIDNSDTTTFADGVDSVICLTGLVNLATSASVSDVLTLA